MAVLLMALWGGVVWWGAGRTGREGVVRGVMAVGLAASMAVQLALLRLDGQLTLQTGLPLHLLLGRPGGGRHAPVSGGDRFLPSGADAAGLFAAARAGGTDARHALARRKAASHGPAAGAGPGKRLSVGGGGVQPRPKHKLSVLERRARRYAAQVAVRAGRRVLRMRAGHAVHGGAAPAGACVPARGYFRK